MENLDVIRLLKVSIWTGKCLQSVWETSGHLPIVASKPQLVAANLLASS